MPRTNQPPSPEQPPPQRYGHKRRANPLRAMVTLHPDSLRAVEQVMAEHRLTRSGAIHHMVRTAAGLPPLPPL